jgi:UMF1 family MFS transporter
MSKLSEKIGNIQVLMGVVLFWIGICLWAYYAAWYKEQGGNPEFHFYGLSIAVGLVMGGIQSLSRSTYSKLMPETKDTASYFSFYDVCDRVGTVLGTLAFGYVAEMLGSMRYSVVALMIFFVIGGVLLLFVNMKRKTLVAA